MAQGSISVELSLMGFDGAPGPRVLVTYRNAGTHTFYLAPWNSCMDGAVINDVLAVTDGEQTATFLGAIVKRRPSSQPDVYESLEPGQIFKTQPIRVGDYYDLSTLDLGAATVTYDAFHPDPRDPSSLNRLVSSPLRLSPNAGD